MKRLSAGDVLWWVLLVIGGLGRLPLLFRGYGSDDDAWRNAVAALRMHEVGHYVPSRIPGFPVYEGLLFLLYPLGWMATNALSILAGGVAALTLARIARRNGIAAAAWVGLAFFLSAPIWVSASQTMDYAVGIMFLLLGYYALVTERLTLSSLGFALAAGSRITLGFMMAPALLFLFLRRKPLASVLRYALGFGVAVVILYLPMLISPEARILAAELKAHVVRHHATVGEFPGLARLVGVFLFTKLGLLVLFVAIVARLVSRLRQGRQGQSRTSWPGWRRAWPVSPAGLAFEIASISLLTLFYLLVPYESAYLLPALPLVLLILGRLLPKRAFLVLGIVMTFTMFATPYLDIMRLRPGKIFQEMDLRGHLLNRTERLASLRPDSPTIYLVPRTEIHRLLILDKQLTPTEAAWAPFRASGVALWSPDKTWGFSSDLVPGERSELQGRGYAFEEPAP